jgi:glycosyltransferase involved in cell wall biosynthesis
MRILCVTPSYPPRVGGGEKYAHRTNAEFVRQNIDVHVITSVPGTSGQQTLDGVMIEYVRAPKCIGFPWFDPRVIAAALRRFKPQAVLAYGPSPYDPITALMARRTGLPFVQVYHADFNQRRFETRLATAVHNAVALRLAATIVCTNETMARTLQARGFDGEIVVSPPGVDERFFSSRAPGTGGDLLFVGALDREHEYKRLDLLLDAVKAMAERDPSVTLTAAGDGDRRPSFEAMAHRLGIADRVRFLGQIGDDALADLYQRARVLVLPSPTAQEGFGLVCLEAMACGLPVVCSADAGAASLVGKAPGCAVWDGERIESLLASIASARQATFAKREALRRVAEDFTWKANSERLIGELRKRNIVIDQPA